MWVPKASLTGRLRSLILLLAVSLPLVMVPPGWARDTGEGRVEVQVRDARITVFTYRPPDCAEPALLLVFHGKGRTAAKMRDRARPLADQVCLMVLAPLFDEARFPNWRYHRAGVVRKGHVQPRDKWTGPAVEDLVRWGRAWLGDADAPYYLFGHSAGGQFLSRTAAYSPPVGVSRIVVANPSVYVVPSLTEIAPYGLGGVFDGEEGEARLKAYLSLPLTIYVGANDTGKKDLVDNEAAMRQGANRFERGQNVYRMAHDLALERGWTFDWRLVIAPDIGHSSKKMLRAQEALQAFDLVLWTPKRPY